mmetsp:Transcript_2778/g.7970  ORF Transcript_2778/g.7970 Transcript_2778/m.7970 type:complete len:282 (-) Transcript_2778:645-1490(-)
MVCEFMLPFRAAISTATAGGGASFGLAADSFGTAAASRGSSSLFVGSSPALPSPTRGEVLAPPPPLYELESFGTAVGSAPLVPALLASLSRGGALLGPSPSPAGTSAVSFAGTSSSAPGSSCPLWRNAAICHAGMGSNGGVPPRRAAVPECMATGSGSVGCRSGLPSEWAPGASGPSVSPSSCCRPSSFSCSCCGSSFSIGSGLFSPLSSACAASALSSAALSFPATSARAWSIASPLARCLCGPDCDCEDPDAAEMLCSAGGVAEGAALFLPPGPFDVEA